MVTTFFVWGFFGGFGVFFVNLLALLAGDIHEECMSASTPEQLCVPVSRAAGRCGQALPHPTPLVWQLYDTANSNGIFSHRKTV